MTEITFDALLNRLSRVFDFLKSQGVIKGNRVVIDLLPCESTILG